MFCCVHCNHGRTCTIIWRIPCRLQSCTQSSWSGKQMTSLWLICFSVFDSFDLFWFSVFWRYTGRVFALIVFLAVVQIKQFLGYSGWPFANHWLWWFPLCVAYDLWGSGANLVGLRFPNNDKSFFLNFFDNQRKKLRTQRGNQNKAT